MSYAIILTLLLLQFKFYTWWRHQMETFPRYWPFVRGIHRSPMNYPHRGQWRGALMFSLICVCINGWINNREAGDLRRYRAHYDVTGMNSLHCNVIRSGYDIATNFFTCHYSTVVVSCEKCCSDWFIKVGQEQIIICNHMWMMMEKLLVKCALWCIIF